MLLRCLEVSSQHMMPEMELAALIALTSAEERLGRKREVRVGTPMLRGLDSSSRLAAPFCFHISARVRVTLRGTLAQADVWSKRAYALKLRMPKYKRNGRHNDGGLRHFVPQESALTSATGEKLSRRGGQTGEIRREASSPKLNLLNTDSKPNFQYPRHENSKMNRYMVVRPVYG
jgi:hypothetical protein